MRYGFDNRFLGKVGIAFRAKWLAITQRSVKVVMRFGNGRRNGWIFGWFRAPRHVQLSHSSRKRKTRSNRRILDRAPPIHGKSRTFLQELKTEYTFCKSKFARIFAQFLGRSKTKKCSNENAVSRKIRRFRFWAKSGVILNALCVIFGRETSTDYRNLLQPRWNKLLNRNGGILLAVTQFRILFSLQLES